jgi:serine/threonine protein kinase
MLPAGSAGQVLRHGYCRCAIYMHRGKYVFRDLKPENVMIDRFGYPAGLILDLPSTSLKRHTHCVVVS